MKERLYWKNLAAAGCFVGTVAEFGTIIRQARKETCMLKIFKYLKDFKWSVLAIIALLIVQAYCDLALPQYTADIVDVGIGQKGIEGAVPERLRESTYKSLAMLLTGEERERMASAYGGRKLSFPGNRRGEGSAE